MKRLVLMHICHLLLFGSSVLGQVYRWDTGQKINDTNPEPYVNITRASLNYADLKGLDLQGATFYACRLSYADFSGACLRSSSLEYSTLSNSNLSNADLTNAFLKDAILTGVDLAGSTIKGAVFEDNTGLTASQIYSTVDYQNGNLSGTGLNDNDLTGWNFAGMDLTHSSFSESRLAEADFTGATVRGTSFVGTERYLLGYNYLGGHGGTPWPLMVPATEQWVSPQMSSDSGIMPIV